MSRHAFSFCLLDFAGYEGVTRKDKKQKSEYETILEKIKNHTYTKDIILTGYVSEAQKRVLLSAAELFLFPSEYEGFGFPVLEAMACGTPVITTDATSLPEVGGDAAQYISVGDNEQLADTVMKLLGDRQKMAELRQKGFERCDLFSWEKTALENEKIYKMAMEK